MTKQGSTQIKVVSREVANEINKANVEFGTVPMDEDVNIDLGGAVDAPPTPNPEFTELLDAAQRPMFKSGDNNYGKLKGDFDKIDGDVVGASNTFSKTQETEVQTSRKPLPKMLKEQESENRKKKSKQRRTKSCRTTETHRPVLPSTENNSERSAIEGIKGHVQASRC